ncbi:hypothetical protein H072_7224 [Dactylellina haptotyla CBS 200.50]|uniref:Uncharacterized protein n=1 Tax=Dactylellina haptotyla (strain CBS 200.50) TaxID=1284197 RepID=S8A7M0_DACHA|nr:hypothetical protein H072_7224 [Dactylellina haptotyla CBS 200.50]
MHIDTSGRRGRDLCLQLSTLAGAELYYLPESREVLLRVRHELSDGIGSIMLLNEFLKILRGKCFATNEYNPGKDVERLPPSLPQIMHAKPPTAEIIKKGQGIAAILNTPVMGLQRRLKSSSIPQQSQRFEFVFNEDETSILLRKCKTNGITITHATTVAASKALLDQMKVEHGSFGTVFYTSLRDLSPNPYNQPTYALSNQISVKMAIFPASKREDFFKAARRIKQEYLSWKDDEDNVATQGPIYDALAGTAMGDIVISKTSAEVNTDLNPVVVSGIGLTEKYLTESVEDFWFSVSAGDFGGTLYVYTAQSKLRLVFVYNSRFYAVENMEKYVHRVVEELNIGLDISLSATGTTYS